MLYGAIPPAESRAASETKRWAGSLRLDRIDSDSGRCRKSGPSLTTTSLAVVCVACICGIGFLNSRVGGRSELLSLPSLSNEAEGIKQLVCHKQISFNFVISEFLGRFLKDNEVSGDIMQNQKLSSSYDATFPTDQAKCHCDCKKSPEMSSHAATMLAQVGEVRSSISVENNENLSVYFLLIVNRTSSLDPAVDVLACGLARFRMSSRSFPSS
jgi:hypothetical protein